MCRPFRPPAAKRRLVRYPPARATSRLGLRSRHGRIRRPDRLDPPLHWADATCAVRGGRAPGTVGCSYALESAVMDRNKHVKDYIAYYTNFPYPPRFAVMLNGPWGIGKTFLLKAMLKRQSGE